MKHQVLRWSSCPSSRSLTRLLTLLIIFFGLSVSCITHVDAQVGLSQLYHRSWTPRDGAPDNIETLIQGPDGFLWLVADTGLFRFDGVSFFPYTPASGSSLLHKQVTSIHATRDGSLWLPYFDGGMARVQNGSVRNYTERDGLIPNNPINSLVQDRQGTVWAGGLKGLEKIKDAQVTTVGPEAGLTGGSIACLALDKEDNLWAVQQQKIMVLPRGSKTFVFAMAWSGYRDAGCKDGRKGGVWLWGKKKPIISAAFSRWTGDKTCCHKSNRDALEPYGSKRWSLMDWH